MQNLDTPSTSKSANHDLILQCIEGKKKHSPVSVKIVPYYKSPLLVETHHRSNEAMKELRATLHARQKEITVK